MVIMTIDPTPLRVGKVFWTDQCQIAAIDKIDSSAIIRPNTTERPGFNELNTFSFRKKSFILYLSPVFNRMKLYIRKDPIDAPIISVNVILVVDSVNISSERLDNNKKKVI